MTTTSKIQIDSSLSALAKAHQELLAHFESTAHKAGTETKLSADAVAQAPVRQSSARRRSEK